MSKQVFQHVINDKDNQFQIKEDFDEVEIKRKMSSSNFEGTNDWKGEKVNSSAQI